MEKIINHNLLRILTIFLYIIIQVFSANEDNWNIICPKKNESYNANESLHVCWEYSELGVIDVSTIAITINDSTNLKFESGFLIAEKILPDSRCYGPWNIDSKISSGEKKVILWNSKNKEMLISGETFTLKEVSSSNFNFNYGIYVIICLIIVVPGVGYAIQHKRKGKSIPTGSRSINTLTINRRKTYEPPIPSYRESWIELPQANSSTDQINIKEIYEYDLLEEAEEAAKNMGLINKVWKAKKVFIPNRDDELLIRFGDELVVQEIYDDLWCYGQNKTLFEEELKKNPNLLAEVENLEPQEKEEATKFGMFPSVVLPIEFRNAKLTKETVDAIKEASEMAKPISDDVVIKKDPNSVVISIPSIPNQPENFVLPVNNLKRNSSLRSSLHRRATQRTNASTNSIKKQQNTPSISPPVVDPITPISPMTGILPSMQSPPIMNTPQMNQTPNTPSINPAYIPQTPVSPPPPSYTPGMMYPISPTTPTQTYNHQ